MSSQGSWLETESAVAIVEFVIIYPFLLLMLMGITDLGSALNTHLSLGRIAYEGARFAAGLPQLEKKLDGNFIKSSEADQYRTFRLVKERMDTLLTLAGYDLSDLPADYLWMRRERNSAGPLDPYDEVEVRLDKIPFNCVFPLMHVFIPDLSTEVRGVYLFPAKL